MVVLEGTGCVGVMQLWTLPAHLPHWKRTVHGTYPRSALWEDELGAGQREAACLRAVSVATIAATVTVRTRQIYFYNYPQHNAAVSHDLWLSIVFLNLPFGPGFGEALSFHYLTALATRHKMAAGAERWKAESGSHFLTELDSDKRTTHDSQTYWTAKI